MARYIPREHGGWSILAISFITGAASGARWDVRLISLALLLVSGYSLRLPLLAWWRRRSRDALLWTVGYLLIAGIAALTLRAHAQFMVIAWSLGLSALWLVLTTWLTTRRLSRTSLGEFLGVIGLAFVAWIAY